MFVKSCYATMLRNFFPARTQAGRALLLAGAALLAAGSSGAAEADRLAGLINAYRAAPGTCEGQAAAARAPLALQPELGRVRIRTGILLQHALEQAGYKSERAQAIEVSGPPDAQAAMMAIRQKYCRALLSSEFSAIGVGHAGDDWLVVLAQPWRAPVLPAWPDAGRIILDAVNAARATPRSCGDQRFGAAPPVTWNDQLADAALAHSAEMAQHHYFSHRGRDGGEVGDRARQAGYNWRRIGENIASGLPSPEEAVAGWLASPGHCANLMNPGFTEMGAAYAINPASETGAAYWTQVFGTPR
jgi:hypothetical protein